MFVCKCVPDFDLASSLYLSDNLTDRVALMRSPYLDFNDFSFANTVYALFLHRIFLRKKRLN